MKCISCERESQKNVKFPCLKCGAEVSRCEKCRSLSIEFKCSKCGQEGP